MNSLKVKTGDTVIVIAGKDKGRKGKILESFPKDNRIIVEGTKALKKNKKPRSAKEAGGIINITGTMDASNVMIVCSKCGKPTRVGYLIDSNGKKARVCKHKGCNAVLDKGRVKISKKDKAEKAEKAKSDKVEKTEKAKGEKAEKAEKTENAKPDVKKEKASKK